MQKYVSRALFVHTADSVHLVERIRNHPCAPIITPVPVDQLMADGYRLPEGIDHAVVSGPLNIIKNNKLKHLVKVY